MELRQLKTLIAIADAGNFVGAADRVGRTQSAVSQQIKALEDELAVELFDRDRKSTRLNSSH